MLVWLRPRPFFSPEIAMNRPQTPAATEGLRGESARDPVCGMRVDPEHAAATVAFGGATYYFCSESCRDRFVRSPEAFGKSPPPTPLDAKTLYTCPMHPEVQ